MALFKKNEESTTGTITTDKKRKINKKVIIIAVIILIAVAVTGFFVFGPKKKNTPSMMPSATETKVEKRDIQTYITGTATIQPKNSYSIISLAQGDVISDYFEEGDIVNEGDILYQLDSKNAEKNIRSAELSLERTKNSYNDTLKTVEDLTIYSNISGSVMKLNVEEGDDVGNGTVIAEIVDTSKLKVTLPFNSADAENITAGQKAFLEVTGTGDQAEGVVSEVSHVDYAKDGHMLVRDITIIVDNPKAITTNDKAIAVVGDYACNDAGVFEYFDSDTIVSKTSGTVQKLYIKENTTVEKGQLAVKLVSDSLDSSLRNSNLSLKDSELSLEKMRDSLDDYRITAPISGTVVTKNVKAGDKVDNTNASKELAVIFDMSLLKFEMSVDELDINKVKTEQEVIITADALNGKSYKGTITNVSINGTTSNGVTTYPITVEITEFDEDLLPGMNIDATIVISEVKDVIAVPVNAVNRGSVVYVKGEKTDEKDRAPEGYKSVQVVTGISNDNFIEIKEGLKEGDVIYALSVASGSSWPMMPGMGGMPGGMGGMPRGGMSGGGMQGGNRGGMR